LANRRRLSSGVETQRVVVASLGSCDERWQQRCKGAGALAHLGLLAAMLLLHSGRVADGDR
jgi:hypothetical protein